jgi:hypothetical protein
MSQQGAADWKLPALGRVEIARLRPPLLVPRYLATLGDVFGEGVEPRLERGDSFELDIKLESYLNQEGFDLRESPGNRLHNGGHDGRNSSTTVRFRLSHLGTLLADGNSPVFHSAHSCIWR